MFTSIVIVVAISLVKVPCQAAAAPPPPPPPAEASDCRMSSHLCKPSSLSLVKTVMNIASVTGCQELCAKDESKKCKFVTFTNFRNIATCHLLSHCDDKVRTTFYIYNNIFIFSSLHCPLSCRRATRWLTAARPPPRAMPRPGPSSAPSWRCRAWRRSSGTAETSTLTIATFPRGLSAPPRKYQSRSALHASLLCARCPSWRNAAGAGLTASSECGEDGSWRPAEAAPPGPLLHPATLPRPGSAGGAGACGCPDLSLGYNPNTEAGGITQFHCTTALAWDQLPVRLGAGARCYLRCDYMLVAAIHCRWIIGWNHALHCTRYLLSNTFSSKGQWSGNPEKGLWCTKDMGPVTIWAEKTETKDGAPLAANKGAAEAKGKQDAAEVTQVNLNKEAAEAGAVQESASLEDGPNESSD